MWCTQLTLSLNTIILLIMKNLLIKQGSCSYYENVKSKRNQVITLAQFVTAIRSGRWKKAVEDCRRLKAEGKLKEAESIKGGLPGIVSAGVCEGGHSKQNVIFLSLFLMLDIDDYAGDIHELIQKLRELPWVQAAWISVSGTGAKAEVAIEVESVEEYEKQAYPIVAQYFSRLLDTPMDMHCRDLSRICYASYDPDAFYKEEPCEPFPWREEWEKKQQEEATEMRSEENEKSSMESRENAPSGLVMSFLERFVRYYPYVPRHRHQFQLAIGRAARSAGMNESELKDLIDAVVTRFSMPDCDAPEIRRNITDAYWFAHRNAMPVESGNGVKGQKGHYVYSADPFNIEESDEDTREMNREIRLSAPCLPDWIFEHLPEVLKRGLEVAKNKRQRDMLFLSMLTHLSACLPNVRMLYDDMVIYPHLFLAVIASSASGKGIMALASLLAVPIQQLLEENNKQKVKEHEEALFLWELEKQKARKAVRKPDMSLRPEPLNMETLMIPADISRNRLIQLMSVSPKGLLLNVSEMDTLRVAVNTDYGKFDDLMRACFHHEMFGTSFKGDEKDYKVYEPKLAFCASGTPNQFYNLCPSMENGSYSRYLIYMGDQEIEFRSMAPSGERHNKTLVFRQLGKEVLKLYQYLKAHPTDVFLTPDQWDWHQSYFDSVLQGVKMEESEGPVSVVLRYGLNTARLAMIFTALRKFEAQWDFYDMKCTDEDFGIAMAVMEVLLKHSLMLSTSMKKDEKQRPVLMKDYFQVRKALERLPTEFHYKDLIESLQEEGFSESKARRCRKRLLTMKIIEQQGDVYRFGNRQWRGVLKKLGSE